jgi:diguanylate cyclase (GGDEF)-like protein/PAS domain S-box-containing protein
MLGYSEITYAAPVCSYIGISYIWAGVIFIKNKKITKVGNKILGWAFIILGIHQMDYAIMYNNKSYISWGFLVASLLQIIIAISMIMIYYQKVKRELLLTQGLYKDGSNKLSNIIENQTDIIYELDEKGEFTFVSSAAKQILGIEPEELMNYSFTKFIAFNTDTKIKNSKDKNYTFDSTYTDKNGEIKYLNISYNPIFSDNDEFLGAYGAIRDVSENKRLTSEVSKQEAYFKQLFEYSPDAIAILDGNDKILDINEAFTRMYDYRPEEVIGCFINEAVAPSMYREATNLSIMISTGGVAYKETVRQKKDGSNVDVSIVGFPIKLENQNIGSYAIYTDITTRKKAENEINIQRTHFKQLFDNSPDGIVMVNNNKEIMMANKGFEELFGYSQDELIGSYIDNMIVFEDDTEEACTLTEQALEGDIIKSEAVRRCKDGRKVNVSIVAYPIIIDGKQTGIYTLYSNITQRKSAEEKLKFLNQHDLLTGIYSRNYFEEKMKQLDGNIESAAMIMFDVDGLKLINDSMGHDSGDVLLISAANLIRRQMPKDSLLARIGGDEFAAIFIYRDRDDIENICNRVRNSMLEYNELYPGIPLSISMGFSAMENRPLDMKQLFKEADNEMYREKLHRSQSTRSSIVQALMRALEARDYITEGHADRLQNLVEVLSEAAGIPNQRLKDLRLFAQFHDIGKVGIPDSILNKPGPLTPEEKIVMQQHSEIGFRIAQASKDLEPIGEWILKHHEWWNGSGYPMGLKGSEIPIECRILAIADAYDAMINDRPYRKAMSKELALQELKKCAGRQFDPSLVEKFINNINIINYINR